MPRAFLRCRRGRRGRRLPRTVRAPPSRHQPVRIRGLYEGAQDHPEHRLLPRDSEDRLPPLRCLLPDAIGVLFRHAAMGGQRLFHAVGIDRRIHAGDRRQPLCMAERLRPRTVSRPWRAEIGADPVRRQPGAALPLAQSHSVDPGQPLPHAVLPAFRLVRPEEDREDDPWRAICPPDQCSHARSDLRHHRPGDRAQTLRDTRLPDLPGNRVHAGPRGRGLRGHGKLRLCR